MVTFDPSDGVPLLLPELLEFLTSAGIDERLQADLDRVDRAYASAMRSAQIFEFCTKLVVPALDAPLDDDAESEALVGRSLGRPLVAAVGDAAARQPMAEQPDWEAMASLARRRRNDLAHEFWWRAFPEIVAGRADALCAELEEDDDRFSELVNGLITNVLLVAMRQRGISPTDLATLASALAGVQVMQPDLLEGLHLIDHGGEVLNRLAEFFDTSA